MSIVSNILKHSAIYSGANTLGKLVGFIMLPFYAHIFDTEGFGIIGMVDGTIGLLSVLFGAASHNAVMRVFHSEDKNTLSRRAVVSTSIWLIWIISILMAAIPLLLSSQLSELLLGTPDYKWIVVLALLTFILNMAGYGAENYLLILQRSITYSLVGILRIVLGLSLNIYLVIILKVGVIGIFLSSFITAFVTGIVLHWIAISDNGLDYNKAVGHKLLSIWVPLIPGEFFAYVGRMAERLFVRFLINLEGVGILEMAYKFPPLISYFISQPFFRAWRTKSFEIADDKGSPVVIGKMFTNMMFLMTAAGLLLIVTIDEILMLMTPESFWEAAGIARIITVSTIIAAANSYFLFGLLYANQPWRISKIKTSMAVVRITISGILISLYSLDGAALSGLIVQIITLIWIFRASQGYYKVDVEYGRIASIFIIAATLAIMIEYPGATVHHYILNSTEPFLSDILLTGKTESGSQHLTRENIFLLANLLTDGSLAALFMIGVLFIRPRLGRSLLRRISERAPK